MQRKEGDTEREIKCAMRAKMEKVRREKERRKKTRTEKQNDNQRTRSLKNECKCGGIDHKRISSSRCPWKGLLKEEVAQNYENRICEIVVPQNCEENTIVPSTEPTSEATEEGKQESEIAKITYS
jgi:hypothetical protein